MPVLSPAGSDVVPHTSVAALLLTANTHLARLGLRRPGTTDILNATGASRSRAYELKDRLEARLGTLTAPAGRPLAASPTPASQPLATRVLSYLLAHPGCVRGNSRQRRYSDGFAHFVMELMAEHPDVYVEALAQTILVPAGTLKDWRRRVGAAVADVAEDHRSAGLLAPAAVRSDPLTGDNSSHEDSAGGRNPSHDTATDPPGGDPDPDPDPDDPADIPVSDRGKRHGLHIETVLNEWSRWNGRFRSFCEHLQQHCAIPFGYTLTAGILEAFGIRLPKRRAGRSPDELALRNAFETFFPHA
jgi:hypothetical protein